MDLDLSDDQVALRDGIASMLAARIPIERVREGFDRAMFDELTSAGVFSLRADGFAPMAVFVRLVGCNGSGHSARSSAVANTPKAIKR